jgi:hypothetical protein
MTVIIVNTVLTFAETTSTFVFTEPNALMGDQMVIAANVIMAIIFASNSRGHSSAHQS